MKKGLWNKDYVLMLQGNAISTLGDVVYSVAIGFWVYEKTGSSALMGLMSSLALFVTMFLSPFCGSIVDKCNRKWLIVGIDVVQGAVMLAVGILAYTNALSVSIVLIAALLASFCGVFYSPAVSTIMLDIIPRDEMVRGQSIHSGISGVINLVGSAFGGALVAFLGVPLIVVINGISNLYSALTEFFVRIPKTVHEGESVTVKGVLTDLVCAIKAVFSDKCLKIFVPSALILNLLAAGPLTLFLPFCMEKGFTVDMYGYAVAIFSVSQVVGAFLIGAIKISPRVRYLAMGLGFTLSIPCFIATYFSSSFVLMCVFAFLSGLLNCIGNSVFNASLMLALPETNRSAILGFINSASVGGTALSAVIYGLLGDIFPLHIIFAVGSAISLIPMIYMCFHRQTKQFVLENCE